MKWILLVALVYGATLVTSDDDDLSLDLPEVDSGLKISGLENLPINSSHIAEAEKFFEQKCIQNGGEEAYTAAMEARTNLEKCIKGLIDIHQLMEEMEQAKPTGDLDEVFRKYCGKREIFKGCIMEAVNASNNCLSENERGHKQLVQTVMDQLLGFVCHKEGDRIALFIAESGPECIGDKKEAVFHCINATFGKHLPTATPNNIYDNIYELPQLLGGAEDCKDVCSLQRCVVKELEKCKEPTPANIVQSMFDYVLKVTPCRSCKEERLRSASSSSGITAGHLSLALSMSFIFMTLH